MNVNRYNGDHKRPEVRRIDPVEPYLGGMCYGAALADEQKSPEDEGPIVIVGSDEPNADPVVEHKKACDDEPQHFDPGPIEQGDLPYMAQSGVKDWPFGD